MWHRCQVNTSFMEPNLFKGNCHSDDRGFLFYNNDFDASAIKRIYIIENKTTEFVRGWQGHKIEQRWYSCISGKFKIELIQIDNWENPSPNLPIESFVINASQSKIIRIPAGYANAILSLETNSKLISFSTLPLSQVAEDDVRFEPNTWKINE